MHKVETWLFCMDDTVLKNAGTILVSKAFALIGNFSKVMKKP